MDLDWQRHLTELRHQVLPIFLAALAVVVLVFILVAPSDEAGTKGEENGNGHRVSLLSVDPERPFDPALVLARPEELARTPRVTRADWPMGSEAGAFAYNAQPFLTDRHLGDDLNGIGGWDSDLGDAVYAVADGEVTYAGWPSDGWGRVVMVAHRTPDGDLLHSFYGHLARIDLPVGARVRRGEKIGTVGKGNGQYLAHLHFELRKGPVIGAGAGYGDHEHGRLPGVEWIEASRGAPPDRLNPAVAGSVPEDASVFIDVAPETEPSLKAEQ
jgi:murein DD-endopeptidase MepM/ murein hydrolase activator NlpD